jgi:Transcriptional regulator
MNTKKYEALLHIAENGSISKTAQELGYTQSGITQMINGLETELGMQLIIRRSKGVKLTNSGKELLPCMREIIKWEEGLFEQCNRIKGNEVGTVKIGCLSSVASAWMPSILQNFKKSHPNIKVNMYEAESPTLDHRLSEGIIDVAITELNNKDCFDSILLKKDEIMAVVPGCHELSSKDTISLSELQKYPFIVYSTGENDESEAGWPGIATGNSIKWDIMYSCKDDMAAMNMVGHELGVTIAASLMLVNCQSSVKAISLNPPLYRSLGIEVRSMKKILPAVDSFINCIEDMYLSAR